MTAIEYSPRITEDRLTMPEPARIATTGQVHAWIRQLAAADLAQLEHRIVRAIERNQRGGAFQRDGYPSGRLGSGGLDAGTSTESAALSTYRLDDRNNVDESDGFWLDEQMDEVEANLLALCDHLHNAVIAFNGIARRLDRDEHLATVTPAYDPSGSCKACDRWVAGTANDRLRSGYCDACRAAWKRFSERELAEGRQPDRAVFERQRIEQVRS